MLERSKWERELLVFSKLVNTLVFTGNVNDQHPIINEREQKIQGFNSLELYLGRMCVSMGYQSVVIYNPVDGFYCLNGIPQKEDGLKHIENIARTLDSSQNPQSGSVNLVKGGPRDSLFIPNIEDAAHIISLALTSAPVPIAIILRFTSRFTARPDDLDMSERMAFMYLQEGAVNARCNRVRVSSVDMAEDNTVIQNKLLLIADKINDLPAWYYLSHPSLKAIDIPRPDYRLREQIIKGNTFQIISS